MKKQLKYISAFVISMIMLINLIPIKTFSSGSSQMLLTVSTVNGKPGDTVEVDITLSNNPGLCSLKFDVAYSDDLTLEGIKFNPSFGAYVTAPEPYENPQSLTMLSPLFPVSENGVFATLAFKVSDTASEGRYDISISYDPSDILDSDLKNIAIEVKNGGVEIKGNPSKAFTLSIENTITTAGDTVEVDITLSNNPGLCSLKFDVAYSDDLTLEGIKFNPSFGAYVTAPEPYGNPQSLTMLSPLFPVSENGVFATLVFKVSDSASIGNHDISISYDPSDILDSDLIDIDLEVINGNLTISTPSYMPGDIDGDGNVNHTDAEILLKYITNHTVEVIENALDTNGDGEINIRDAATILLYLDGQNIVLH